MAYKEPQFNFPIGHVNRYLLVKDAILPTLVH